MKENKKEKENEGRERKKRVTKQKRMKIGKEGGKENKRKRFTIKMMRG